MRYHIFCDQHKGFYEAQFPDPASRFSELYDLFCRGLQPECIRTAMHSVRRPIKNNTALKKRFVEQIERDRTVSSSTYVNSFNNRSNVDKRSSYVTSQNSINNNNETTSSKSNTQSNLHNNNNVRFTTSTQSQQHRPQPHIPQVKSQQPASRPPQSILSGGASVSQVSGYYASGGRATSASGAKWADGSPRTQ